MGVLLLLVLSQQYGQFQIFHVSLIVYVLVCLTAIAKYHRVDGLQTKMFLPHSWELGVQGQRASTVEFG